MYEPELLDLLNVAAALIADAYDKDPSNVSLDQEGLITGKQIVLDYISHGEHGLAIEHLLYMIHESEVTYPKDKLVSLHEIAKRNNVEICYELPNT